MNVTETFEWNESVALTNVTFNFTAYDFDFDLNATSSSSTLLDKAALAWMATAAAVTVVGNIAIGWIIVVTPSLLTTAHNRLVLNLACCDLLTAALNCPPTMVALVHDAWIVGDSVCQLNGVFTTLFGVASVMTLSVISLNRFFTSPALMFTTTISLFTPTCRSAWVLGSMFDPVRLSVCLSVCPQHNWKTKDPKVFKLVHRMTLRYRRSDMVLEFKVTC